MLAAACDLRLMSRGTIGLAELSVGVPFPPAAVEILRYAIGPAAARLLLTAALLDPSQARSAGLVHDLEDPGTLLEAAVGRAQRMAQTPAEVFTATVLAERLAAGPAPRRSALERQIRTVIALTRLAEACDRLFSASCSAFR